MLALQKRKNNIDTHNIRAVKPLQTQPLRNGQSKPTEICRPSVQVIEIDN